LWTFTSIQVLYHVMTAGFQFHFPLLYSGKLLREKTFANFAVSGYLQKFSLQNLGVWHLWCCKSEQFANVFSLKIVYILLIHESFLPWRFTAIPHTIKLVFQDKLV